MPGFFRFPTGNIGHISGQIDDIPCGKLLPQIGTIFKDKCTLLNIKEPLTKDLTLGANEPMMIGCGAGNSMVYFDAEVPLQNLLRKCYSHIDPSCCAVL